MTNPQAMVLYGDGINADGETAWGLTAAGFSADRVHTSQILESPDRIFQYQLLALPGGFSFGDEIASGKILAVKLRNKLQDGLFRYIDGGGLVLGICNGFQVLVQMGLLPVSDAGAPRTVSLSKNAGGQFINRWVELNVNRENHSPFLQSLDCIHLPIRHGEGRLRIADRADALEVVLRQAALRYAQDVNGSFDRIAGLTNASGNVLGLMPHPEACVSWMQHPNWKAHYRSSVRSQGPPRDSQTVPDGLALLKNAFQAVR